jgi:glyoxylase-like metal-dependent hydrolase (beta-lactamase superfamily II)
MWFEAPVVAHEAAARHMLELKPNFVSQAAEELSKNDNELVEIASVRLIPPQVSYHESLALYCGEREVTLYHRPGACYGNSWLALPDEKLLFAGDSVVVNQHPPITEGWTGAWLQTLSELQSDAYADWTIVPGRGKPVSPDEVKLLADYLTTLRRRVASLSKSGRPRSELGGLVGELLGEFPHPAGQREEIQRRIRMGLEIVYEEIRSSDTVEEAE